MLSRRQPLQLWVLQHRWRLSLRLSWRLLPSRTRVRKQPAGSPHRSFLGDIAGCQVRGTPDMLHHHTSALCHQYNLKELQRLVRSHSHMSPQRLHARLFLPHHKILMLMCISSSISLIHSLVQLLALYHMLCRSII